MGCGLERWSWLQHPFAERALPVANLLWPCCPPCFVSLQSSVTLNMLGQEVTYEVLNVMEYTSDRCAHLQG